MRRSAILALSLLASLIVLPVAAPAQSITGDLVVNVTDPSGAVVGGAKLELMAVETNVKFEGQTDNLGNFLFSQLKPGHYKLDVTAVGFRKASVTDINITIGQRARVDAQLKVGTVAETVAVSAAAETLLNAESASVGQVITTQAIVDLPLNGRNFIQLAQISAGAAPIGIGNSPATSWTGRTDSTLSIAGGRETNNSFLVNGIETRNARFGSAGIRPSADAVEEFRVQRTTFGAEFGRSSAIINTTIRSGSNDVHLAAWEFLRNRSLDANDFFANRSSRTKPPFTQNNFGTAVGGPVVLPGYNGRNKTFWFFNYEGFRQRQGITSTGLYPSPAQMAGNLADDSAGTGIFPTSSPLCQANHDSPKCVDVIDPTTVVFDSKGNVVQATPFTGNVILANRLDLKAQKWLAFIPTPNVSGVAGQAQPPSFNYTTSPKDLNDMNQFNVRADHTISSKDQLSGSYSFEDRPHISPS